MNWAIIQSWCFVIMAGSLAVITFVLYGLVKDLMAIRTDMTTLVSDILLSGKESKKGMEKVPPDWTEIGDKSLVPHWGGGYDVSPVAGSYWSFSGAINNPRGRPTKIASAKKVRWLLLLICNFTRRHSREPDSMRSSKNGSRLFRASHQTSPAKRAVNPENSSPSHSLRLSHNGFSHA